LTFAFERWFAQQHLGDYIELNYEFLEKSFKDFARYAWEAAFELGQNVACEGAYDDGYDAGYHEGRDSTEEEEVEKAYKDGHADGFKEGLNFKMEDFV
jgi:flagellar biosynthesis/type III secretory pathway protein FliH